MIITVKNKESLQAVLKQHSKVILMCKAGFACKPCDLAYDELIKISQEKQYNGILFLVMKILNVGDVTPIPDKWPTFITYKNNIEMERGLMSELRELLAKLKDNAMQPQPTPVAPSIAEPTVVPTIAPAAPNNLFLSQEEVADLYKELALLQGGEVFARNENSLMWVHGMPELNQRVCDKPYPVHEFRHTENMQSFQLTNAQNYELLGVERKEVNGKLEKLNVVNIACIWLTDGSYEIENNVLSVQAGELLFLPKGTKISGIVLHKNMIA